MLINDALLLTHSRKLANYDFESQVDVNILGHIFENSLNEIESVNAEIEGDTFDKQTSKRKKDGVFYTPKYITKYIVENTVGKLCEEKKAELGFEEAEYFKSRKGRNKDTLLNLVAILDTYRDWLLQITICDPACGSGAFLNQALDFLIKEHRYIDELKAKVLGGGLVFADIENTILENNIYGVDLNEESVEIAKLSLWLRTAQPRRKLNDLSSNIKCGNSLIDSKAVAGDKAFKWEQEFPHIFEKGGFDVVIGNPPYVIIFDEKIKSSLEKNFPNFKRNNDLYVAFYEKAILSLLLPKGILGFITPNSFIRGDYFESLRNLFFEKEILEIIDFQNELVFDDANVYSAISIIKNDNPKKDFLLRVGLDQYPIVVRQIDKSLIAPNPIWIKLKSEKRISNFFEVKDVGFNYWTIGRGKVRGASIGSRILYQEPKQNPLDIPYIKGSNFIKYSNPFPSNYLIHNYEEVLNENDVFRFSEEILKTSPKLIYRQTSNKLIATIDYEGQYTDKTVHSVINKKGQSIDLTFLLLVFNSKLMNYLYQYLTEDTGKAFAQVKTVNVKKLPFKNQNKNQLESNFQLYQLITNLGTEYVLQLSKFQTFFVSQYKLEKVSRKLESWHELEFGEFIRELNKSIKANNKLREKAAKEAAVSSSEAVVTPSAVEVPTLTKKDEFEWMSLFEENKKKAQDLQTQINQTEREIDQMVYELYGLTEEEIQIVENS